jgi:hypothetical protein
MSVNLTQTSRVKLKTLNLLAISLLPRVLHSEVKITGLFDMMSSVTTGMEH